jgi:hypothetical protein
MDREPTETGHSFVIRMWPEETAVEPGAIIWRGHITHVPGGERRYFQDLDALRQFIQPYQGNMAPLFSFDEPADSTSGPGATAELAAAAMRLTEALNNLLTRLRETAALPGEHDGLPAADATILSVEQKLIGLGHFRGQEMRRGIAPVALKGGRLLATVQFQLWGASPGEVGELSTTVHGNLLGALALLQQEGFLRLKAGGASLPEHVGALDAWRKTLLYEVLYEYHYEDADGAEGLIARIPVHADLETHDSPDRETGVVTDALARWDDVAAPAFELRGVIDLRRLNALVFLAGLPPTGAVEWLRTTTTATTPPQEFAAFDDFLAAVTDPDSPALNARFAFPTLIDFLNRFDADPNLISMGNWNADEDDLLDTYVARSLQWERPLRLRRTIDRLRITYAPGSSEPRFDHIGIVYLRAG